METAHRFLGLRLDKGLRLFYTEMDSGFHTLCGFLVGSVLLAIVIDRPSYCFPGATTTTPSGVQRQDCPDSCRLVCRGSGDSTRLERCYCRCRSHIDYGTLVYTAVVDDIWQVRCGYLGHPFVSTALAMNESGLLDEFAFTRCKSDYTDECRSGDVDEVCTQWWAVSLCRETCADFVSSNPPGTTTDSTTTMATARHEANGLCAPDKYFRNQRPSFGNPYSGCIDFQRECNALYDRGYCQLKASAVNCQDTCGRCIGDDAYMPWNPVRCQLIQWAMNRRDDGTAKALINYFMRQYSDYISEVHRSCRLDIASLTSQNRQQQHRQRQGEHHLGQEDAI